MFDFGGHSTLSIVGNNKALTMFQIKVHHNELSEMCDLFQKVISEYTPLHEILHDFTINDNGKVTALFIRLTLGVRRIPALSTLH